MDMQGYVDEIKLELPGGLLNLELQDAQIQQIVNSSLRELQRYVSSTKILTIPYSKCISLKDVKLSSISRVYRSQGLDTTNKNESTVDPIQAGLWQITSNTGNLYNFNDYMYRYASWTSLQQIGNTLSTDLSFYYDDAEKKLYINTHLSSNTAVTIEYVPRYDSVEEITSDFWVDILMRLSKANAKAILGRLRGRFTQSNALWTSDAATMLQEVQTELNELRTYLTTNTNLIYPLD